MWRRLILSWVFCCSLFSSKVFEGFEWETYDRDKAQASTRFSVGGLAGSDHSSFKGWLYGFAYKTTADNALNQDSSGFYFGMLQAGKLFYGVAYAVDISSLDHHLYWYSLAYYQGSGYNGWYLYQTPAVDLPGGSNNDFLAKLTPSDFTTWDLVGLSMTSADADGSVPINPGRGLSIFDYSFSMPRKKLDPTRQSAYYRDFFSKLEPKGNNRGLSPDPVLVDQSTGGVYSRNLRLLQTHEFSVFLVEQLRRLSSSYDSDGGGRPDYQEWDGSGSSLVYFWNNPEDDFQPLPGVQEVDFIGGGSVDFDPPPFDEPPAFEFPDGFDLGPDSSDWSQKVLDASSKLRDKLEPLRGRFLPLFEDLKEVDPVHRVEFASSNKIGFLSSIPINLDFDFSGGSLGSPVVSALSLIRSVLVVLIYAVLIWVIFSDVTRRDKGEDND